MDDQPVLAALVQNNSPFKDDLAALSSDPAIRTKGFDGVDILTILLPLSAAIIPAVVKIVTKSIEAKQYIVIKHKGVEIRGVSEEALTKVLRQLAEPSQPRKAKK
jgi:hypothetical protein